MRQTAKGSMDCLVKGPVYLPINDPDASLPQLAQQQQPFRAGNPCRQVNGWPWS
jgi:hypothetical protein